MATEKRLIDANALVYAIEDIDWFHVNAKGKLVDGANPANNIPIYRAFDIYNAIKNAPAVDAVEVSDYDSIVYKLECLLCHATGGKFSKASYSLADMERMVTDYIEECCEEAVAAEVIHGRWVGGYSGTEYTIPKCSRCGYGNGAVGASNYCPNCGAKMDGGAADG